MSVEQLHSLTIGDRTIAFVSTPERLSEVSMALKTKYPSREMKVRSYPADGIPPACPAEMAGLLSTLE